MILKPLRNYSTRIAYLQASDIDLATSFISERIKNEESVIFLAYDSDSKNQDSSVGFTQLYPLFSSVSAKPVWVLNDLYVSSEARKLGIGKQLMEAARVFAIESGAKGITLETAEDNVNAQGLYESLGYEQGSGFRNYFLSTEKV